MKRYPAIAVVCVTLLTVLLSLTASATSAPLLLEEGCRLTSQTGDCFISPDGSLVVTAPDENGASVAIDVDYRVDIQSARYVQLSLQATAPFNIALKLSDPQSDIYPQTAGPAWYEAFQDNAPHEGEGVKAGSYTFSLDLQAYIQYNGLEVSEDGYADLKTVYVFLKDAGSVTVEHLLLSDTPDFQTVSGKTGTAAYTPAVITTHTTGTLPTTQPTYDAGGVTRLQESGAPIGVVVLLIAAAVLIVGTTWMTVKKQKTT